MVKLQQTNRSIYYIHSYTPKRYWKFHREDEIYHSKLMLSYKDCIPEAIEIYTDELMQAIAQISKTITADAIGLVAVPPSKANKQSAIKESIHIITAAYTIGTFQKQYGCSKQIYDYGNLLMRYKDIPTAHEGYRPNYDEQYNSICCIRGDLSKDNIAFLILDDVTTNGISMQVCRDILIDHGVDKKSIRRLAISKTG